MSLIDSFYYILNCNLNSKPKFLVKVINQLCLPSLSIQELFDSKFCTALTEDLITLTNYKIIENNNGENIEQVNRPIESIVGLDFVNYEHSSHLVLKSILIHQYSTEFTRYCNFLNKLVIHIVLYQFQLFNLQNLTQTFQTQLSDLFKIINQNKKSNPFDIMKFPRTLDELEYFISNFLFKVDISFEIFEKCLFERKYIEFELYVRISTNADIVRYDGITLLMFVAQNGPLDCLIPLIENQASFNATQFDAMNPFLFSVLYGNIEYIECFIDLGSDVNYTNNIGYSALTNAIDNGNLAIVKLLVESGGAKIEYKDFRGFTSLILAVSNGNVDCVRYLIEQGVYLDYVDNYGGNALLYAVEYGKIECVKLLLEYGSNIEFQDSNNYTPLIKAVIDENIKILKLFIEYKVNLDYQNNYGYTALMFAAQIGNTKCMEILLENQANVHLKTVSGWSALMYAAQDGHDDCIKLLIKHKANIDDQNMDGWTALMIATGAGKLESLQLLLHNKADLGYKNAEGMTALVIACQYGHQDIIQFLTKYKSNN